MNRHWPHKKPDNGLQGPHPSLVMPPPPGISTCDKAKTLREHTGCAAITAGKICSSSPIHHSAWVVERYQLLTLSLPHICRLSRVFTKLLLPGEKQTIPKYRLGCLSNCRHHFTYTCAQQSPKQVFQSGEVICMLVGDRELLRARARSSPSLCLSLLNLSGVRWRQKQQIPAVQTCYSHTFRKSPRNYQRTFLSNGSIPSFISAAPLFTPKAVVWMKG